MATCGTCECCLIIKRKRQDYVRSKKGQDKRRAYRQKNKDTIREYNRLYVAHQRIINPYKKVKLYPDLLPDSMKLDFNES